MMYSNKGSMGVRIRLTEHQVRLLALCKVKGVSWNLIAGEAQRPDGLDRLWSGTPVESSPEATKAAGLLAAYRSSDKQVRTSYRCAGGDRQDRA
jgi:hypothetical protein